jgi:glycosyltransferase involved in cell wall biosynthesis
VQERDGIRLVKAPDLLRGRLRSGWDIWNTIKRMAYLLPKSFDLVHSVDSRPACILPAMVLKELKGTKLVLDWGDWWGRGGTISERCGNVADRLFAPVETFFEEEFRRFADGSVVLTSALERRAVSLGVSADSIIRIPHGADVEGIRPLDKCQARQMMGINLQTPILGYVGLLPPRDESILIGAFEMMKNLDKRLRLFIIGNSNVNIPTPFVESGCIVKTGRLKYEYLQQYIACCDIMLLPLRDSIANRGRWPSKIGDYLAAGKPVITTRVGDAATLIEEEECGMLCEDTPEDFALKTLDLLYHPDWIEEMGHRARKVAETKLDWCILTDQLERFYFKVLNR